MASLYLFTTSLPEEDGDDDDRDDMPNEGRAKASDDVAARSAAAMAVVAVANFMVVVHRDERMGRVWVFGYGTYCT